VKGRLTPFVQRHWRRAFYWVAIAGLGYLTVPEEYYDRFFAYVDGDDPNYDGAVGLLSLAAVRDEEGEATLKKFFREKNRIRLEPANKTMKPIFRERVDILGVLVGVVRKY